MDNFRQLHGTRLCWSAPQPGILVTISEPDTVLEIYYQRCSKFLWRSPQVHLKRLEQILYGDVTREKFVMYLESWEKESQRNIVLVSLT